MTGGHLTVNYITYYHKDNQNGKRMKFQKNYKLLSLFNKEVTFLVKEVTKNSDLWLRVALTWSKSMWCFSKVQSLHHPVVGL